MRSIHHAIIHPDNNIILDKSIFVNANFRQTIEFLQFFVILLIYFHHLHIIFCDFNESKSLIVSFCTNLFNKSVENVENFVD